jgi:hypothetical protein
MGHHNKVCTLFCSNRSCIVFLVHRQYIRRIFIHGLKKYAGCNKTTNKNHGESARSKSSRLQFTIQGINVIRFQGSFVPIRVVEPGLQGLWKCDCPEEYLRNVQVKGMGFVTNAKITQRIRIATKTTKEFHTPSNFVRCRFSTFEFTVVQWFGDEGGAERWWHFLYRIDEL